MKVVSFCFNGWWELWIGRSFELTFFGMLQTVCRTSWSDVMSFYFSKQDLIEAPLNCYIFSSRNYFKRSKSCSSNILSKFNVWFAACCVFGLDDSENSRGFLWPELITSEVLPVFWSPLLGLEREPGVWWHCWVFSLTWIFFVFQQGH